MKRGLILTVMVITLLASAATQAEPAWGKNCLSCHSDLWQDRVWVFGEDTFADPDESGTGAPDRGTLPVFQVTRGQTKLLQVSVADLSLDDTYAVQLKRLRFPGVETGGELVYQADCEWPEWGENTPYYTEPIIAHRWGEGPTTFAYEIGADQAAESDYYDLIFAVAGKAAVDGSLFYARAHFYLQVSGLTGDMDCNGVVDFDDISPFVLALSGEGNYQTEYPDCNWYNADCDGNGVVDFDDIDAFIGLLGG